MRKLRLNFFLLPFTLKITRGYYFFDILWKNASFSELKDPDVSIVSLKRQLKHAETGLMSQIMHTGYYKNLWERFERRHNSIQSSALQTWKYAKMLEDSVELFQDRIFRMKLFCRTKITFKAKLKHLIDLFLIWRMRYFSIMFHLSFLYYENE